MRTLRRSINQDEEVGESQPRSIQAKEEGGVSHRKLRKKALHFTTGKYTCTIFIML